MTRSDSIDSTQKKINSMLFRVTLITYAIIIISNQENIFKSWVYVLSILLFISTYIVCLKRSFFRLINDFVFIILILWGKDPMNIYIFTFLILPIINSINFSGQKKTGFLYLITYIEFQILFYFYYGKLDNIWTFSLPIISLWGINTYTNLRLKVKAFREELIETVDNFYLDKEQVKKPYRLYKKFISLINTNTDKDNELVGNLYCFTINKDIKDKIVIVNGTSFIWYYKFSNVEFITNLRKGKPLFNEPVILEGIVYDKNFIIYTSLDGNEYFYLFTLKRDIPFYYDVIGFYETLEPALIKMSKTLLGEKLLQDIRNEEILKLSEKILYVNRANNMMHFIRNRLGPFANLVKMIEGTDKIPTEKIEPFKQILIDQNKRAQIELRNITDRADDMLEKSKNPFFYSILDNVSVQRTFILLRKSFTYYFPEEEIEIEILASPRKRYVQLNEEGFEVFLSDWLNNIKKYQKKIIKCTFTEEKNFLEISFVNDYIIAEEDVDRLVNDFMSSDRNEIMKRTTYGLSTIKSTLESMNVSYDVKNSENLLRFTIIINILDDENSDI